MAANIPRMYTYFEMFSTNLGANAVIPVFDTDYVGGTQCSGSCDTVTIDTQTCSKGGSCIENRILTILATSSDPTAQLTVVHGGESTPMSCTSGNCSVGPIGPQMPTGLSAVACFHAVMYSRASAR